jgi:hypothetical protein
MMTCRSFAPALFRTIWNCTSRPVPFSLLTGQLGFRNIVLALMILDVGDMLQH